ncbi:MAG: trypsin-like peptidase domain-containing protein [Planctomycetota bacterium]
MTYLRLIAFAVATAAVTLLLGSPRAALAQDDSRSTLKQPYDTEGSAVLAAFAPVVRSARRSVVAIARDGEPAALGTVISADGLILTKASEVRGDTDLTATLADGRTVAAHRLKINRAHDVALLQLDAQELTPVDWATGLPPRLGQWVIVPGLSPNPEAIGVLSALPRRVHGVRLGIRFGENRDGRVVIGATLPGMGAAEAGLQPGDLITGINGVPTTSSDDVIDNLRNVNAGDTLPITVERRGRSLTFPVEMRLRPLDPRDRNDVMNTMGNGLSLRRDGFPSIIQHDATIEPNQCGGPLLDLDGRCIGINIARAGRVEAYALPADVVAELLADLSPELLVHDPAAPALER